MGRRRVRGSTTIIAIGLVAALAWPASALPTRVNIRAKGFRPVRVQIPMDTKVAWLNRDDRLHRVRSFGRGFISTDRLSPGELSGAVLFRWAGSFRYRCPFHPSLRGAVRVPVKLYPGPNLLPTPGAKIRIRMATSKRDSVRFDVQRRRNDGDWITFRRRIVGPVAVFRPHRTGTYAFRARVHLLRTGALSGWSPLREKPVVSPP
jgi:plastocyanin